MKRQIITICIALSLGIFLFSCTNVGEKTPEPLAPTPPMGFNSYDSYGNFLFEETAIQLMDVMAEKYLPFGYEYFVIDLGWYNEYKLIDGTQIIDFNNSPDLFNLDTNGLPEPSKTFFPGGIKPLVDYAHSKGLKFGLHLMRGVFKQAIEQNCVVKGTNIPIQDIVDTLSICDWCPWTIGFDMDKPGAEEYYKSMIEKLAGWGVDFIKYDDITGFPADIIAVSNAIEECGYPIVLSLSPGDDTKLDFLPYYKQANMLRTTHDIWDSPQSINTTFEFMKEYQGLGNPGFWPDLDMLALGNLNVCATEDAIQIGGMKKSAKRKSLLNREQTLTFLTQRAISATPLFIGGDLLTMDEFTYSILTNKEMIACNQNGVCGFLTSSKDSIEIYKASDKNNYKKGWLAIFNRKKESNAITLSNADFGFSFNRDCLNTLVNSYKFNDIWNDKEMIFTNEQMFSVPGNGVLFMVYEEIE